MDVWQSNYGRSLHLGMKLAADGLHGDATVDDLLASTIRNTVPGTTRQYQSAGCRKPQQAHSLQATQIGAEISNNMLNQYSQALRGDA
jgi:hypothetical protein